MMKQKCSNNHKISVDDEDDNAGIATIITANGLKCPKINDNHNINANNNTIMKESTMDKILDFDHRKRKSRRNIFEINQDKIMMKNMYKINMKDFIWIRAWSFDGNGNDNVNDDDNNFQNAVNKYCRWPFKPIWSSSTTTQTSSSSCKSLKLCSYSPQYSESSSPSSSSSSSITKSTFKKFSQPYHSYYYYLLILLTTITILASNSLYAIDAFQIMNNNNDDDVNIQHNSYNNYHHHRHHNLPQNINYQYLNTRNDDNIQPFLPQSSSINYPQYIFTPPMMSTTSHQRTILNGNNNNNNNHKINNNGMILDDSIIALQTIPYNENIENLYHNQPLNQQYYFQQIQRQPRQHNSHQHQHLIPNNNQHFEYLQDDESIQNLTSIMMMTDYDRHQRNQSMIINDDSKNSMKKCSANEFECIRDSTCIDLSSVGDGIMDCIDGSDECPDPIRQFRCRCGTPACIDRRHYMDGQINCDDGSDEGLLVSVCQDFIQNELLPNGMLPMDQPIMPTRKPIMQQPPINIPLLDDDDNNENEDDKDDRNSNNNSTAIKSTINENSYMAEEIDDPILFLPENLEELFSSEFSDSIDTQSSITITTTPTPSTTSSIEDISIDTSMNDTSNTIASESDIKIDKDSNNEKDVDNKNNNNRTMTSLTTKLSTMSSIDEQITPNTTIEISTSTSTLTMEDVVELTGTFLPYELLTNPTNYPYYHRSMATPPIKIEKLTDTNSIVEITGTFIPVTMTADSENSNNIRSTQSMSTVAKATDTTAALMAVTPSTSMSSNITTDRTDNITERIDENRTKSMLNLKQATNQTFIIGNRLLTILTGIYLDQNSSYNDESGTAFIVACAQNRIHRQMENNNSYNDRSCDNVPIKIRNEHSRQFYERIVRNNNSYSDNNGTLLINIASTGKSLNIIPVFTSGSSSSNNMKMIHAKIELNSNYDNSNANNDDNDRNKTKTWNGLGWKDISKIEVNSDRKYVPYTVKDIQPLIVNVEFDNKKQLSNVQIVESDDHQNPFQLPSSKSSSPAIMPTTIMTTPSISSNYNSLIPSRIRSKYGRPRMHTTTVGRFGKQDEEKKLLLDNYFNGNIPQYDPTVLAEQTSSKSTTKSIQATSTIFGFIDFTTLVNGTMLIFTPKTKVELSSSENISIQPTKVASINENELQTSSTVDESITNNDNDENDEIIKSFSSTPTITSTSTTMNHEIVSSKKLDKYNEYLVTSDGLTITNGFILPSFSSNVPNSLESSKSIDTSQLSSSSTKPLKLIATTYTTKHTDFITEQINGELRTRTSEIISTNVVYNSINNNDYEDNNENSLHPTKPLKTYFTTYTYYTTFKNSETEFVHSRKEIVTNIVDPEEENNEIANIISATASFSPTSSSSSIFFSDSMNNDDNPTIFSDIQLIDTRPLSSSLLSSSLSAKIETMNDINQRKNHQQIKSTPSLESSRNLNKPTSLNKSYLGKLLSGIAVPITHYTTFTYYTTFFRDSTSQIVSRTNVISNIVTGTINLNNHTPLQTSTTSTSILATKAETTLIQKRSIQYHEEELSPAAAENLPIVITPVTEFSTSTLYTTFFIPGQGSTVVTNTHIYSNIYLPDVDDLVRITSSSSLSSSLFQQQVQRPTKTIENYPFITTINYDDSSTPSTFVERIQESTIIKQNERQQLQPTINLNDGVVRHINGIPVVDNQIIFNTENVRNDKQSTVVPFIPQSVREQRLLSSISSSLARIEIEGSNDNDDTIETTTNTRRRVIKVTKTKKLSDTLFTNNENEQKLRSTVIVRRPSLSSNSPNINNNNGQSNTILFDSHYHDISNISRTGRLYPSITPTPVTYYTTYTYFTTELINGRPIVRSNEHLFSTVITGKILPTRVIPDQRLRRIRRTIMIEEDNFTKTSNQHSFDNININANHQSSESVENSDNILSNEQNQHSTSIAPGKKIGVVSEMTNKNGDKTLLTQIIGTMINGFYAQFAITKTLEPSITMSSSDVLFNQPEPKLNLTSENDSDDIDYVTIDNTETTTELSNDIDDNAITTTETTLTTEPEVNEVENQPFDTMIDDSWLSDENISDEKSSLMVSSIEPVSTYSSLVTPKLSSSFEKIDEKPIESTTSMNYRTGLLESTIETLTNYESKNIIHLTKEIYGTYIGGIYAHLAKTRTETFTLSLQTQSTTLLMSNPESITSTTTTTTTTESAIPLAPSIATNLFSGSLDSVRLNAFKNTTSTIATIPIVDETKFNKTIDDAKSTLIIDDPASTINSASDFSETKIILSPTFEISSSTITSSASITDSIDDDQNNDEKKTSTIDLWPSLPGLSSISYATGTINDTLLVVHTTEFYTTQINGFTAHYSRETYNSIGTIDSTTTSTTESLSSMISKPSVHFPTPVRFLFSTPVRSQVPQVITTVVTVTTTLIDESAQNSGLIQSESNSWLASRKFRPNNNNNYNNDDNNFNNQEFDDTDSPTYLLSSSSSGQMPRSRTIREKDNAQPYVDYDDVDYADQIDTPARSDSNSQSYPITTFSTTTTTTTTAAPPRTSSRNSYWQSRRNMAGFGQRVGSASSSSSSSYPSSSSSSSPSSSDQDWNSSSSQRIINNNRGVLPRRRNAQQQSAISRSTSSTSPVATSATRSLEIYHYNDYINNNNNNNQNTNQNNPSRSMSDDRTRSTSNSNLNNRSQYNERNKNYNRNRVLNRNRSYYSMATTTSTTTTTPAPSNINLLTNQRLRLNRKYSRNRLPHLKILNRDKSRHHSTPTYQRSAQSESIIDPPRKFGRGNFRSRPLLSSSQSSPVASTVYSTQTLPKTPITVTSIATTVKTVPIFHGFRTSYATLTTTTLNTSIIPHTAYETSVGDDGITRTLFTRMTDQLEPHKVTEILVTTSALQEVKLVPIKFGYSTRTETLTDVKTFTMLTTLVSTDSFALLSHLLPPPPGSTLTTTTYVTEHTLSSTTSVSLLLHGKTLVSTLTFTSVAETTVTKTLTVPINTDISSVDIPSPLITMLTLSIRGENGDLTELVTAITVPLKPQTQIQPTIMATKVERDIRSTSRYDDNDERLFDDDDDYLGPLLLESSTGYGQHHHHHNHQMYNNHNNNYNYRQNRNNDNHHQFISTSFMTVDSQLQSLGSNSHPYFFKGTTTESYEANALPMDGDDSKPIFRKRKLLQYSDNIYKEIADTSNSFMPERTKQNRKFQRVRIKPKSSSSANNHHPSSIGSSEPGLRQSTDSFNRLVGINDKISPSINYGPETFNSFRRQPLQLEQPLNLYSSVVASIPPVSSTASYLLANNFQKPTYRKIKPQQSRRIVSSIKHVNQPIIQPSNVLSSDSFMAASSTMPSFIEIPNQFNQNAYPQPSAFPQITPNHHHQQHYPRLPSSPPLQMQPDPRHVIQHLNHGILPHRNRNQFNVMDDQTFVRAPGGVLPFDTGSNFPPPSMNDDLSILRSPTLPPSSLYTPPSPSSVQQEATIHTPTIPLTYYTTFTYLTTVIRGQHTAHLSRESVTSTIKTRALDKSIVEIVRDSDGIIEPTRLRELGTKTKGHATTIYNALYQVQIYNEDLYKVIQKTYNKDISFKPWQPSTTTYHPIFVTNHVDVPKETPTMEPESFSTNYNEFDLVRTTKSDEISTPTYLVDNVQSLLSSSIIEPSYQPVENTAEPTPTIDSTLTSSTQSSAARPSVRISSSVVRKPYNPRYTQPLSRSRLRMRISSRTSHVPTIESLSATTTSSSYSPILEINNTPSTDSSFVPSSTLTLMSSFSPSYESPIESTVSQTITSSSTLSETESTSKSYSRPNFFRSKVIFRPRPGQTAQPFNSKMMRISSRLIRPSTTSSSSSLAETSETLMISSPTPTMITTPTLQTSSVENGNDKLDHSDAARANKFVRVSNGVTLIVSSRVPTPTRPFTFEPTLVTGAAVIMKDILPEQNEPESLSSLDGKIEPSMTTETVKYLRTSTLRSTMTYFATLFNGSTSSITPIEDVKTEFITFPDTTTVTRPIHQTNNLEASLTLMTDHILFKPTDYITSTPKLSTSSSLYKQTYMTSLKSTYTTLTHYITLFHGSHTVLSSIEEISPTVVTETFGVRPTKPLHGEEMSSQMSINVEHHHHIPNIRFTQPSVDAAKQSKNLFGGLVPSVSTLFTTHTYFTTLFSGTTSIIQSREEITHSLITMYVPSSQMTQHPIMATTTYEQTMSTESPQLFNNENEHPQMPPEIVDQQTPSTMSSTPSETEYVPEEPQIIVGSGSVMLEPSKTAIYNEEPILSTSTLKDTTDAVVYFTNFILPSNVIESENTIDGAKGPINPLLNHGDLTLVGDNNRPSNIIIDQPILQNTIKPTHLIPDAVPVPIQTQSPAIKPGAIIELTDLLDGANLAGNIGEAIKDIVQILAKGQKNKMHPTPVLDAAALDIDRTSVAKDMIMPPKDGVTVSHIDDPVYIPINRPDLHQMKPNDLFISPTMALPSSSIFEQPSSSIQFTESMPSVAYVPVEYTESEETLSSKPTISSSPLPSSSSLPKSSKIDEMFVTSILIQPSSTITVSVSDASSTIIREPPFLFPSSKSPIFSTAGSGPTNTVPIETKYITNVENSPSTIVMTTTKVYYTRDSPLTITSSYTSTMPLRTVVTTIFGSKTILNTYTNEIKPTKSTQIPSTSSTKDSNTRIQIQPQGGTSTSSSNEPRTPFRPTRKPGVNRFKPPSRPTEAPKIFKTSHRPRQPYKPSPTPPPDFELEQQRPGGSSFKKTTKFSYPKTTTRPAILDLDQCKPGCNTANKEICKEIDGKFKCDCRPGYIKKSTGNDVCLELQNFIVLVRVTRLGDQDLEWNSILTNHTSDLYQNLAKAARNQIDTAYVMINSMKENYVGADVLDINKAHDGHGVLVNMTIHLTESNNIDEDLIREELSRTLMMKPASTQSPSSESMNSSSEQLPSPQQIYADLEDVIDFDECSSEEYNDCASSARCINEPGSYRCECLNGYPDLDLSFPGRMCASEIKACEFCYGRGDCYRDETGQISSCKCHRMYLGRRCEINGLLLAIFIPVIAILSIITICSIVYCCRKWRNRALVKGFRNFSAYGPNMIGSTLDRKAMLETSSDNSDPLRSHMSYEGPVMNAADATLSREYRRRRESEHPHVPHHDPLQYNGELVGASYPNMGATSIPFSTQFMIPRVRNASSTSLQTYGNNNNNNGYVGNNRNHKHHYHGQNNNNSHNGHGHAHNHHHHHHNHHMNNNNQSSHHHHHHHTSSYDYDGGGSGGSGGSNGVINHRNHHQYGAW